MLFLFTRKRFHSFKIFRIPKNDNKKKLFQKKNILVEIQIQTVYLATVDH